jgi:SnoaL-like domain
VTERELADEMLTALATSDVERVRELTAGDVVLFGTDEGERWDDVDSLVDALEEMRALGLTAAWSGDIRAGGGWVAGTVIYRLADGSELPTRVSLVFEDGRLVHGHFSVAR